MKSTVNHTYYDSNFKNLQCISGKHRSFDDLVKIVKTYFRVSDKTIAKNLKKILDKNDNLITSPATSPENQYKLESGFEGATLYGGTADLAMIRECFDKTIKASKVFI